MKKLLFGLFALGLFCGCRQPQNDTQRVKIEVEAKAAQPPVVVVPPQVQVAPSASYLEGYNDGYYGHWVAPARWVVVSDYRNGRGAGSYDREHGLPHRYNK